MPRTAVSASLLAAAALVCANPAYASPVRFSFSGALNGSFIIDSTQAPVAFNTSNTYFVFTSGTGDFAGTPTGIVNTRSFNASFAGSVNNASTGIAMGIRTSVTNGYPIDGPLLFSGPLSAPVFTAGTYSLTSRTTGNAINLRIAPGAPVPEVGATWAAALAAGIALALTRRRKPALAA